MDSTLLCRGRSSCTQGFPQKRSDAVRLGVTVPASVVLNAVVVDINRGAATGGIGAQLLVAPIARGVARTGRTCTVHTTQSGFAVTAVSRVTTAFAAGQTGTRASDTSSID